MRVASVDAAFASGPTARPEPTLFAIDPPWYASQRTTVRRACRGAARGRGWTRISGRWRRATPGRAPGATRWRASLPRPSGPAPRRRLRRCPRTAGARRTRGGTSPGAAAASSVGVTGSEGNPIALATDLKSKKAGACSSAPTTATGTIGVAVSSAMRMNPLPNSCRPVALVVRLVQAARSLREHHDRLARREQAAAILRRSHHLPDAREEGATKGKVGAHFSTIARTTRGGSPSSRSAMPIIAPSSGSCPE